MSRPLRSGSERWDWPDGGDQGGDEFSQEFPQPSEDGAQVVASDGENAPAEASEASAGVDGGLKTKDGRASAIMGLEQNLDAYLATDDHVSSPTADSDTKVAAIYRRGTLETCHLSRAAKHWLHLCWNHLGAEQCDR